ncbi:MAG: hypothetical protein ACPGJS_18380 [Flammeovirgaceae bacterium]
MQLDFKRILLLGILIVILFVNWYYYQTIEPTVRISLQNFIAGLDDQVAVIGALKRFNMLYKWITVIVLVVINVGISITIIYVYFWDKKIFWQGTRLLLIYSVSCFVVAIISYYIGMRELCINAINALEVLSTPIVECAMIPILKLMNAETETVEG